MSRADRGSISDRTRLTGAEAGAAGPSWSVNDEIAFQAALQPRYDLIESLARQAVYYTQHMLQNQAPATFAY